MKRKKLNLLIALFVLFFYLVSSYFIYSFNSIKIGDEFEQQYYDIVTATASEDFQSVGEFIKFVDMNTTRFPSRFELYEIADEKPKFSAKSGSMIYANIYHGDTGKGEEVFCFLDDYINNEISEKLGRINLNYALVRFDYNMADGKCVPVFAQFENIMNGDLSEEIVFSEEPAQYSCVRSENDIDTEIRFDYYLIDADKNSLHQKTYALIDNELEALDLDEAFDNCKNSISGPEMFMTYNTVFINGEEYFYIGHGRINLFAETISSDNFKGYMYEQTFVFAVVSAVIFILINKYYSKREKLNEAKQAFISAAAHELKTPLAAIENHSECIIENVMPQKNDKYIRTIHSECLRMNKLVSDLLQYNRLASAEKIEKTACSLSDIVNEEAKQYLLSAHDKNIVLETDIAPDVNIKANENLIALVVDNYLSNAVKYTANGGRIMIKLEKQKLGFRFSVFNEGSKIDKETAATLWDIFYKSDKSRNSSDNSTGMGLAICRQILEFHNFRYGFDNKADGVEFWFKN